MITPTQLEIFCQQLDEMRMAYYTRNVAEYLKDGETAEEYVVRVHGLSGCTFRMGPKLTKVWANTNQQSIYCFVDNETGNIYKAAGCKAPEPRRHIRGNILKGVEGLGPYGPAYLR